VRTTRRWRRATPFERGLEWERHAFDELILPSTLVSFLP
jgi:hypothetical protein